MTSKEWLKLKDQRAEPGQILDACNFYQSSCWHCDEVWSIDPISDERGLVCPYCFGLNEYTG